MVKQVKKLLISILSLVFALTIFGTVTYAWFSISTLNVLHNIAVGVQSEGSFQISLDGINYYDTIDSSEIAKYISEDLVLKDVTSLDGETFLRGGPLDFEPAEANKDYLSLTLYFRSTNSANRYIYLVDNVSSEAFIDNDVEGTYVISRGVNWYSDTTFQYGENPEDMIYIGDRLMSYSADALRIATVEKKIVTNNLDIRDTGELQSKIFDLSKNPSRGYGASYGGLDYYNKKENKNIEPPETMQEVITELSTFSDYNPHRPENSNSHILRLIESTKINESGSIYYIGMININFWIEGWDADGFDSIKGDVLRINLKFKNARII